MGKEERKRNIKAVCVCVCVRVCVCACGKHNRMTTVSNAVGTRTVIPLLILVMWQNLMLMSESKVYLIFYSEIFVTDTRIKLIKKTWKVSIG